MPTVAQLFNNFSMEHVTTIAAFVGHSPEGEDFNSRPEYWLSCLKFFVFFFQALQV
jgi:hypothetical protein